VRLELTQEDIAFCERAAVQLVKYNFFPYNFSPAVPGALRRGICCLCAASEFLIVDRLAGTKIKAR
jgi:hypothetical protein